MTDPLETASFRARMSALKDAFLRRPLRMAIVIALCAAGLFLGRWILGNSLIGLVVVGLLGGSLLLESWTRAELTTRD